MTAIIDSKAMAYLELHANKPVVNLFDTIATCLKRVEELYGEVSDIIFAYDIGKSKYRLDLWENYKGKRTYTSVPSEFKRYYEDIVPIIATALGIKNINPLEVEADDIAGILCSKIKEPVVLLTVDHDWYGLVLRHNHVQLFDVKKYELLDKQDIVERSGCQTEDQFIIKKCIVGDTGDHIIGVPTIGPIKYKKWADRVFSDPRANNLEFLKEQFILLCDNISTTHKTHRDYMYVGVHSCSDLLDFNIKLGTIMSNLSLLTDEQKEDIKSMFSCKIAKVDPVLAKSLSEENSGEVAGCFGEPYAISPVALNYYEEVFNRK